MADDDEDNLPDGLSEEELLEELSADKIGDLFKVLAFNRKERTKVTSTLVDQEGDEVSIKELTEILASFMKDKLNNPSPTQFTEEIFPLMATAAAYSLPQTIDYKIAYILLSEPQICHSIIQMMSIGFLLLKYIQSNKLSIVSNTEPMTEQEIERLGFLLMNKEEDPNGTN